MGPFGLVQAFSTLPPTALLLVQDPGLTGPQLQLNVPRYHCSPPPTCGTHFFLNDNHVDLAPGPPHGTIQGVIVPWPTLPASLLPQIPETLRQ